jgi:NAD+ kinase
MAVGAHMTRVLVMGTDTDGIGPLLRERGLRIVSDDPEVVLTYGGDGLLLRAEAAWPGVPKLPLRNSRHGFKCQPHQVADALDRLIERRLVAQEHFKVRGEAVGRVKIGLNDVCVHNARPTSAVRYRVWIDGHERARELVGDGVVVASPFGSTAYYRTITRGSFREGLGLAFNNSMEPVDHIVLPASAKIRVRVTRGPALLVADNQPDDVPLDDGDEVVFRRDESRAVILGL